MIFKPLSAEDSRRFSSLPDLVAHVLREATLQGDLVGGTPLKQEELAAQLEVSRLPVRDALRQLDTEGLVSYFPNRGAVVTQFKGPDIREVYVIRRFLEVGALRQAVPKLTAEELNEAERLLDQVDLTEDSQTWGELDLQFHMTLYALKDQKRLAGLIRSMRRLVDRYTQTYVSLLVHKGTFQPEHRALLQACRERNHERAGNILDQHIEHVATLVIEHINRIPLPESAQ